MSKIIKPENYHTLLNPAQTEQGIKLIKDFFQSNLSTELRLRRITAPLFVLRGLGINDDLNGVERPVHFPIKDMGEQIAEVVHSLAKWKRLMLAEYNIQPGNHDADYWQSLLRDYFVWFSRDWNAAQSSSTITQTAE